jgi:hypothetical protein
VPFQPVRGAGQHTEQGPLRHPLAQRRLQRQRRVGRAGCPVLLQAGPARLVDHQVGVAGVARVGRGALRSQLGVQRLPETPRIAGQPDLGAKRRQKLGAPLNADQLISPAGVGLGAVDGHLPSAQLLRQTERSTPGGTKR